MCVIAAAPPRFLVGLRESRVAVGVDVGRKYFTVSQDRSAVRGSRPCVYPLISSPIDEIDETGALDDGQHELGGNRARPHELCAHFALNVFHRGGVVVLLIMRTIEQRYSTVTVSFADRPQASAAWSRWQSICAGIHATSQG